MILWKRNGLAAVCMATVIALGLCGCGAAEPAEDASPRQDTAQMEAADVDTTILYEDNGVTVNLVRLSTESLFPGLEITVNNQSGQNLTVATDLISANGVMISAGSGNAIDSQNGEVMEDTIFFNPENMMVAGVNLDNLAEVDMEIEFYAPGTLDNVFEPVRVNIPVNESAMSEKAGADEPVIFENDQLRLSLVPVENLPDAPAEATYVRVENRGTEDLSCRFMDFTENGEMLEVQPYYSMGFGWARQESYATIFGGQSMVVSIPIVEEEHPEAGFILENLVNDGEEDIVKLFGN